MTLFGQNVPSIAIILLLFDTNFLRLIRLKSKKKIINSIANQKPIINFIKSLPKLASPIRSSQAYEPSVLNHLITYHFDMIYQYLQYAYDICLCNTKTKLE